MFLRSGSQYISEVGSQHISEVGSQHISEVGSQHISEVGSQYISEVWKYSREIQMDTRRNTDLYFERNTDGYSERIHLFNKKSVEIHNPHARNRKTYHADEKMVCRFSFSNSTMRCMACRQDYSTYFGAAVTFHNCRHHIVLIFCIFAQPPDAFGALVWCHLCEIWVETF
jgi:hypothetical protein